MVSPSAEVEKKVRTISQTNESEAVQDVQKKGINPKAIIAGIAVAVVLFILILLGTKLFKNDGIEVDSFVGMNYELQIKDNEEYNERYKFEVYYASFSDAQEGSVYDQDPKAGTSVEEGSTIILYIAKAGEGQVVPDFTGRNFREASNTLENLGFRVVVVPSEDSSVAVGQVIRTEPAANTTLAVGATITVYYAADTDSDKLFKMPKLEGKSLEAAKEILEENGLVLYKVESADSSVEKDYVLNQSPADGSPVREGDTVVLTVSSGLVNAQKTLSLPKVGTVTVKVVLDGDVVKTESVNTSLNSNYVVSASGSEDNSELAVYLNDALFYEATVNFTREPAKFTKEKTYDVAFYADVVGLTETEAVKTLNNLGYKNITVKYEESFEKEGTVINQSPSYVGAQNLDKTAAIVLTVCKSEDNQSNQTTLPEESSTDALASVE